MEGQDNFNDIGTPAPNKGPNYHTLSTANGADNGAAFLDSLLNEGNCSAVQTSTYTEINTQAGNNVSGYYQQQQYNAPPPPKRPMAQAQNTCQNTSYNVPPRVPPRDPIFTAPKDPEYANLEEEHRKLKDEHCKLKENFDKLLEAHSDICAQKRRAARRPSCDVETCDDNTESPCSTHQGEDETEGTNEGYPCPVNDCSSMLMTKEDLLAHITSHDDLKTKKFYCYVCGKKFAQGSGRNKHVKHHHKGWELTARAKWRLID